MNGLSPRPMKTLLQDENLRPISTILLISLIVLSIVTTDDPRVKWVGFAVYLTCVIVLGWYWRKDMRKAKEASKR